MAHNWSVPGGGIDPLLKVDTPLTPDMLREVVPARTFRYFIAESVTNAAFPSPTDPLVDVVPGYRVFIDQGRTGENFESSRLVIVNDGAGNVDYSFDGVTVHGTLYAGESKVDDERRERKIFLRRNGATSASVRVWAW